jgi:hypothetical protein
LADAEARVDQAQLYWMVVIHLLTRAANM